MSTARDVVMIDFFKERDLQPARVVHRHDRTVEIVWYVDDCDERYVRAMSSAHGDDYVLVVRDRRTVESVVLEDRHEIFNWVRTHLHSLVDSSLNQVLGISRGGGVA